MVPATKGTLDHRNVGESHRPGNSAIHLIRDNLLIAALYWGISHINRVFFSSYGVLPMPIWPAASLAVAVGLVLGWRGAPGIALGTILANAISLGSSVWVAAGISVMNTAGPIFGTWLIRKSATRLPPLLLRKGCEPLPPLRGNTDTHPDRHRRHHQHPGRRSHLAGRSTSRLASLVDRPRQRHTALHSSAALLVGRSQTPSPEVQPGILWLFPVHIARHRHGLLPRRKQPIGAGRHAPPADRAPGLGIGAFRDA